MWPFWTKAACEADAADAAEEVEKVEEEEVAAEEEEPVRRGARRNNPTRARCSCAS
jgi:cytochrome c oxidase subunit 6b